MSILPFDLSKTSVISYTQDFKGIPSNPSKYMFDLDIVPEIY